jgi:hypothetical protein
VANRRDGHLVSTAAEPDAAGFPAEPFSKWGYIVDIDTATFEVYRGRWAVRSAVGSSAIPTGAGDHHPCALLGSWSFDLLPTDAEFLAALSETDPV